MNIEQINNGGYRFYVKVPVMFKKKKSKKFYTALHCLKFMYVRIFIGIIPLAYNFFSAPAI